MCLVSGYLTGISACFLSLLYQRLPDPKGTCGGKKRVPEPHGHKERRRMGQAGKAPHCSYQSTGLWACCRRYGDFSLIRRLV